MKKPNRIARKGDTARNGAQAKHGASAPAKSIRKAARKPSAAKAAKPKSAPEAARAAAISLEENPHGEHVCEVEHNAGAWETLYRRGENDFTLVNTCMTVHDGRYWRTWEEWSEIHPGVLLKSLPPAKVRRMDFPEKLHRGEVVAWLWDHFGSVAIPADFAEEFRPSGIAWKTTADDARKGFCALAELALKTPGDAESQAGVAISLMHVATALGLKEEASQAARIINCHNASATASYGLCGMMETGMERKA